MLSSDKSMKSLYLHLEQDSVILKKNIVGIFDMDKTTVSKRTREFLRRSEHEGCVRYLSYDLPRSFIVCLEDGKNVVYISRLSSVTIIKRLTALFEGS